MKRKFIQTSNVQNFYNSLTGLQERGASEACLIVVDGVPGLGKTHTLTHWVAKSGSIYLRAKREWTPNWALSELLKSLMISPCRNIGLLDSSVSRRSAVRKRVF